MDEPVATGCPPLDDTEPLSKVDRHTFDDAIRHRRLGPIRPVECKRGIGDGGMVAYRSTWASDGGEVVAMEIERALATEYFLSSKALEAGSRTPEQAFRPAVAPKSKRPEPEPKGDEASAMPWLEEMRRRLARTDHWRTRIAVVHPSDYAEYCEFGSDYGGDEP